VKFKKGQSGNPSGRPKSLKNLRALLIDKFGPDARVLIERLLTLSQSTNPNVALQATEVLLAYHSGKPTQSFEHSGPDGGAIIAKIAFGGRYRPEGA
jgi:hypothetical protein